MTSLIRITLCPSNLIGCAPPPGSPAEVRDRHRRLVGLHEVFERLGHGLHQYGCDGSLVDATLRHIDAEMQAIERMSSGFIATTPADRIFQLSVAFTWAEGAADDGGIDPDTSAAAKLNRLNILAETRKICADHDIPLASVVWLPAPETASAIAAQI